MTRKGELGLRMVEGKESINTRTTGKLRKELITDNYPIFLVIIESKTCVGRKFKEDKGRLRQETERTRKG